MKKALVLAYGVASYGLFFVSFLYLVGFLANAFVPVSIDTGGESSSSAMALIVNLGLVTLFGIQHSVMARPGFKRAWTKIIPQPIERSTYVLASTIVLIAMMAFWQPMPTTLWDLSGTAFEPVAWGAFAFGWAFLLFSTFVINHFDLFGLRQVFLFFRGRQPGALKFTTRIVYRFVRHPLYLGWMIAMWATPTMTVGHLVFALGFTLYLFVAVPLEERDLIEEHGERYREYRRSVPAVIPRLVPAPASPAEGASA